MRCPECSGPMWDNRPKKEAGEFSAKSPDFKCKDKECGGVIWPEKSKKESRNEEIRGKGDRFHEPSGADDRQDRIERQHSQEMALRFFALTGKVPTTPQLRDMISWFQRDIRQAPTPEPQAQPEQEEEIPF